MALSRSLSQSLPRASLRPPTALISHHRHRSNKTHQAQLLEVDLDSASSSPSDSPDAAAANEIITVGIKKLEDAIHSIIVRRAAPDWLPFLPGYSYWVPPRPKSVRSNPGSMIDVIGKLASSGAAAAARNRRFSHDLLLSEDEQMSLSSRKGWPSASFFIEGTSPVHPIPLVEVEMKIQDNENADDTSNSEDEEG